MSTYVNYSRVNNETLWQGGEEYFSIEVALLNEETELVERLNFTWECIDFKETEMTL